MELWYRPHSLRDILGHHVDQRDECVIGSKLTHEEENGGGQRERNGIQNALPLVFRLATAD